MPYHTPERAGPATIPAPAAPPAPPLPDVPLMWEKGETRRWWRYALTAVAGAAAGAAALNWLG